MKNSKTLKWTKTEMLIWLDSLSDRKRIEVMNVLRKLREPFSHVMELVSEQDFVLCTYIREEMEAQNLVFTKKEANQARLHGFIKGFQNGVIRSKLFSAVRRGKLPDGRSLKDL